MNPLSLEEPALNLLIFFIFSFHLFIFWGVLFSKNLFCETSKSEKACPEVGVRTMNFYYSKTLASLVAEINLRIPLC